MPRPMPQTTHTTQSFPTAAAPDLLAATTAPSALLTGTVVPARPVPALPSLLPPVTLDNAKAHAEALMLRAGALLADLDALFDVESGHPNEDVIGHIGDVFYDSIGHERWGAHYLAMLGVVAVSRSASSARKDTAE